jgi:hypothetical protein
VILSHRVPPSCGFFAWYRTPLFTNVLEGAFPEVRLDEVEEEFEGGGGIVLARGASAGEDPGASFACFGDDDHLVLDTLTQGVIASALLEYSVLASWHPPVPMLLDRDLPLSIRTSENFIYVFAATQVTGYMLHAHDALGILQGLLVLALL